MEILLTTALTSVSAVSMDDFEWYKFNGTRPVKLENKTHEVQVDAGERIGVRADKRNVFSVIHEDAPNIVFPCDAKTARSLVGRSTPYKGRVKGKAVNNSRLSGGTRVVRDPTAEPPKENTAPPVKTKSAQQMLTAIRSQPFHKPRSITYAGMVPTLDNHILYYFDATSSYKEALKSDAVWEKFAEKLLVSALAGQDCEVGAQVVDPTPRKEGKAYLIVKVPE